MELLYYSSWQHPKVAIRRGRRRHRGQGNGQWHDEVPMQPVAWGRAPHERVYRAEFELRAPDGFIILGDHGMDRPEAEAWYRPRLGRAFLQDGRLFAEEPAPRPEFTYHDFDLYCAPLRFTFHCSLMAPRRTAYARPLSVAILNDGQNQWKDQGMHGGWHSDSAAQQLMHHGRIRDLALIAVWMHERRHHAYLPRPDGRSDLYASFLADQVLPKAREFADLSPHREDHAVIGSSWGGIGCLTPVIDRPDAFSMSGCMSFSFFFSNPVFRVFQQAPRLPWTRLYLDCGTRCSQNRSDPRSDGQGLTRRLIALAERRGYRRRKNLYGRVFAGHCHDERSWRSRIAGCLEFLFPPAP